MFIEGLRISEQDQQVRNISSILYRDTRRLSMVERELGDFLAESLVMPTVREVVFDGDGFVEVDSGERYSELLVKAIESVGEGLVRDRFIAEKKGFIRAGKLVQYYLDNFGFLPAFVIASPPGDVYRGNGEHTKSSTFVFVPNNIDSQLGQIYRRYSIFTDEVELEEHVRLIDKVGAIERSLSIINEMVDLGTAEGVVALPVLLNELSTSLDELVKGLGFQDWDDVENKAFIKSRYENESWDTRVRREAFVDYFSTEIRRLVFLGKGDFEFAKLDEVIRLVFAAERDGFFVEKGMEEVEVRKFIEGLLVERGDDSEGVRSEESVGWDYGMFRAWVMNSSVARDSYLGTACGVGGSVDITDNYLFSSEFDYASQMEVGGLVMGSVSQSEVLAGSSDMGEKQCYKCPVCSSPKGDVYKKDGYLVCSKNPEKHKIRATG